MMLLIQLPLTIDAQQETDTSTGSPVAVWKKNIIRQKKNFLFLLSISRILSDPSKSHLLAT